MYEIEKGIEMPRGGKGRKPIYPFRKMNVGESFFVQVASDNSYEKMAKMRSIMGSCRKTRLAPKEFTTKIETGGIRVWRVK
jgi:hypothetical protein